MIFTSFTFLYFFASVFFLYWIVRFRKTQNYVLLLASYVFYGWIHPWFCLLLATSTIVDYFSALGMKIHPARSKIYLCLSLFCNFGILSVFKYFNFFIENISTLFLSLNVSFNLPSLQIILPVGISFYTFQTMSYSIDVYRGKLEPRTNFFDYALFVSFFPQLLSGPIGRGCSQLPQIENERKWDWVRFNTAWHLIVRGLFKKLVIADNLIGYVDKVYMLQHPDFLLFAVGTLAFTVQIYADFSGYTDIARGCARLLGFELMENFKNPYIACSPSDFWRRWHISLSTWIRDYVFISMGGSKHKNKLISVCVMVFTMLLCGLWHGAAWNFIIWGIYHGVLLVIYQLLGMGGKWKPLGMFQKAGSIIIMFQLTLLGWSLFRASSLEWYLEMWSGMTLLYDKHNLGLIFLILLNIIFFTSPLLIKSSINYMKTGKETATAIYCGFLLFFIVLLHSSQSQDFIYFQF